MPALLGLLIALVTVALSTDELPYFTSLGDKTLSKSTLVVRGKVIKVGPPIHGAEVARVAVDHTYKGDEKREISVFASQGDFFVDNEYLLFLRPYGDDNFTCDQLYINRTDPDFESKVSYLEQNLRIGKLTDEDARKAEVRGILYENARSEDEWTRSNLLRELDYVFENYPELLRSSDLKALEGVADEAEMDHPEYAKRLRKKLKRGTSSGSRESDRGPDPGNLRRGL